MPKLRLVYLDGVHLAVRRWLALVGDGGRTNRIFSSALWLAIFSKLEEFARVPSDGVGAEH